jgi:type IV secretory pathway TraG/TraD family ATPase VirD4
MFIAPPSVTLTILVVVSLGRLALRAVRVARSRRAESRAIDQGALVLGRDHRGRPVIVGDREFGAHALILGASGAGKSTTLVAILRDRIARGLPVVALDLKGSPAFANALAEAAADAGRPFLLWSPDGPARWNPLACGNPTELKDKLIATERFSEPHYQRAAERYLQTALTVLKTLHPGWPPTLDEVVALSDPRRLQRVAQRLPEPLRSRVGDYLSGLSSDQLSAARGLGTRLAVLTESHIGPYLQPDGHDSEIDLRAALRGEAIVLFSLNSSSYGKLAAQIGTMVVQDLISATGERLSSGLGGPDAVVAIDEFSALAGDHMVNLMARGREAGVSTLLSTQEMADLARAAPGVREQVLGNTAVKIIHRQDVPASAQAVSEMAGMEWGWQETRTIGPPGYRGPRGSRRQVEQPVVHPNTIKALRTGEAVAITKLPSMRVRVMRVASAWPRQQPQSPRRDGPAL